jgi:glycogen debranching enzyme
MLEHNLVLKSDELYLVGNISTDASGERALGLYLRDTRHLSRFFVTLNDMRPDRLSARVHNATSATVTSTNQLIRFPDGSVLHPHQIALEQHVSLDDGLHVAFVLQNFTRQSLTLALGLEFGADFRDLFDIRGFPRHRRGVAVKPRVEDRSVVLGYRGLDDQVIETTIAFDQTPSIQLLRAASDSSDELIPRLPGFDAVNLEPAPADLPGAVAMFDLHLGPGERWELRTVVTPHPAGNIPIHVSPARTSPSPAGRAEIVTDDPFLNRVLDRADQDLAALMTSFPEGALPAAGIPWYVAPFGRDSLIVGLQTLALAPARAAGTLRVLAALQGTKIDDDTEEEPGKILHEMRYGEMARCHEVPHRPYFGSVDATPLFVWLFAETVAWTADDGLYRDLLPNARRALEWIERYGDRDGDGFVEYSTDRHGAARISNQVWKDSFDSLNDHTGQPVTGLIAAVEVQGYVFAAYARLADVAAAYGDDDWAAALRGKAEAIRDAAEAAFWLEEEGFYAQALDGEKRPVRAVGSNPGHLLACGLPSPERAALVAARLRQPDLDSGWGVRTLSSAAPTYNPMSYHNGSVWPHDNSLIAAGLYRYGQSAAADAIAAALFAAARTYPLDRLPELYCGFARTGGLDDAPVAYPVSCSPQAWAAGTMPCIVGAMLGLRADIGRRALVVSPALPDWLNDIAVRDLQIHGRTGTLTVRRRDGAYRIDGDGLAIEVG